MKISKKKKYRYVLLHGTLGDEVLRFHRKECGILRGFKKYGHDKYEYYERQDLSKYNNIVALIEKYKGKDWIEITKEKANELCLAWYKTSIKTILQFKDL